MACSHVNIFVIFIMSVEELNEMGIIYRTCKHVSVGKYFQLKIVWRFVPFLRVILYLPFDFYSPEPKHNQNEYIHIIFSDEKFLFIYFPA